jgi:hypothetical protein
MRSVYWEQSSIEGMGANMKDLAVRAANFPEAGKLTEALLRNKDSGAPQGDGEGRDDFDVWAERVERGFIEEPGVTDPTNPYGRDYERRPRIRKIGEQ